MHVITYYSWLSLPFLCFRLWVCRPSFIYAVFLSERHWGLGIFNDTQLSHVCWLSLNRWQGNALMFGTPSQKAHRDMERQWGVKVGEMEGGTKGWCWQLACPHHLLWFISLREARAKKLLRQHSYCGTISVTHCKETRCFTLAVLVCFMVSGGKVLQPCY